MTSIPRKQRVGRQRQALQVRQQSALTCSAPSRVVQVHEQACMPRPTHQHPDARRPSDTLPLPSAHLGQGHLPLARLLLPLLLDGVGQHLGALNLWAAARKRSAGRWAEQRVGSEWADDSCSLAAARAPLVSARQRECWSTVAGSSKQQQVDSNAASGKAKLRSIHTHTAATAASKPTAGKRTPAHCPICGQHTCSRSSR